MKCIIFLNRLGKDKYIQQNNGVLHLRNYYARKSFLRIFHRQDTSVQKLDPTSYRENKQTKFAEGTGLQFSSYKLYVRMPKGRHISL